MAEIDDAIAITASIANQRLKISDQHVTDMLADLSDATPEEVRRLRDSARENDAQTIGSVLIKRIEKKRRADADGKAAQVWADNTLNPTEFLQLFGS